MLYEKRILLKSSGRSPPGNGTGDSRYAQKWRCGPIAEWTTCDKLATVFTEPHALDSGYAAQHKNYVHRPCGESVPALAHGINKSKKIEAIATAHEGDDSEETEPPVIFNQDDYGELARNVDACLNPTPHDLLRSDCTELDNPLRELLYATDQCTQQEPKGTKERSLPLVPSEQEAEVCGGDFARSRNETGDLATYVHSRLMTSTPTMMKHLTHQRTTWVNTGRVSRSFARPSNTMALVDPRGGGSQREDWMGAENPDGGLRIAIGEYPIVVIDFGDTGRVSEKIRGDTPNIDNREPNQCVVLHLVAGAQWDRTKRQQGIPEMQNVLLEVEEWGFAEIRQARLAVDWRVNSSNPMAQELQSLVRAAINSGHDVDCRRIPVFLNELPAAREINVRVFDLRTMGDVCYESALPFPMYHEGKLADC